MLNVFRQTRNSDCKCVVRSIIATDAHSLSYLRTSNNSISSFNGIHIQNSNFILEEVGGLFRDFAKDYNVQMNYNVIENVFQKTNGYVSQFD